MAKEKDVQEIEKRFIDVAGFDIDVSVLSAYPLTEDTHLQVKTDKEKSDTFGEVFTPLWLVDKMLDKTGGWCTDRTTLDMCAGYGQFTIRMIRKMQNQHCKNKKGFKLQRFLTETHSFNELQLSSCYKLLYIFGRDINLFIGDSRKLTELDENDNGIMYYSEDKKQWINVTERVKDFYNYIDEQKFINSSHYFEDNFESYVLNNKVESKLDIFCEW